MMDSGNKLSKIFDRHTLTIELCAAAVSTLFLVYTLRKMLITGETTLIHDNLYWNYPIYQFFAENLMSLRLPYWNPFSHGGEPFYPALAQLRFYEPAAWLTILLGRFVTNDIVMLFNWNRFIELLVTAFGVHIVLRRFALNVFTRASIIPILLFSSFMLGSFRQDAILNQFIWVPYITYFFLNIIWEKDHSWHNYLMLGAVTGLNWQSYFFTGAWIFSLFFVAGVCIFRIDLLRDFRNTRPSVLRAGAALLIVVMMAAPDVVLFAEKGKFVFPARMVDDAYENKPPLGGPVQYESGPSSLPVSGIIMPYKLIAHTGTFSHISDFIQLIAPDGNDHIRWPNRSLWGKPSEAYMYLGFLPWAISLIGVIAGTHELKRVWLFVLAATALLMLGPAGGLHKALYYVYPPMWFVRHTHTFVLFFIFSLLFFYVIGLNHLFKTWETDIFPGKTEVDLKKYAAPSAVVVLALGAAAYMMFGYTAVKELAKFVSEYLSVFIPLGILTFLLLWKTIGSKRLYAGAVVLHVAAVLVFSNNAHKFLKYMAVSLLIPITVFLILKIINKRSSSKGLFNGYFFALALVIFYICLLLDLTFSLRKTSFLYESAKHPGGAYKVRTTPQRPDWFWQRSVYIEPSQLQGEQSMRYLSVLHRKADALSTVMPDEPIDYTGKKITLVKTSASKKFFDLPLTYSQDGDGGEFKEKKMSDGSVIMSISPSSEGNSLVQFRSSSGSVKDAYVWFSVKAKSMSQAPGGVQIDVQDGVLPVKTVSYGNSGEWETLTVEKHIDGGVDAVFFTLNVKSEARSDAIFKDAAIQYIPLREKTFEYGLRMKRWSSFLLTSNYYKLIHSGAPHQVIEKTFAIGEPQFQFKRHARRVGDDGLRNFFAKMTPEEGVRFLEDTVILSQEAGGGQPAVVPSGGPLKNPFRYTVHDYDYNSIRITAVSDEDGFLYWSDGFDKSWKAYVNGVETGIYRANVNFKAIPLIKGTNEITFVFEPALFKAALSVFYSVFSMSVFAAAFLFLHDKRNNRTDRTDDGKEGER